jgi:hypothetical protein
MDGFAQAQKGKMMNDLISRQAAISAICNACGKIDCDKMDKCEKLQLPPANCSEFPNNSDTISRQAVIDALDKRFDSIPIEQTTEILLLRKDLRDLPAAEPQRIKGKWALQSDDYHEYYECDQCGIAVGIDDIRNFCPNCGAEMEVTT